MMSIQFSIESQLVAPSLAHWNGACHAPSITRNWWRSIGTGFTGR